MKEIRHLKTMKNKRNFNTKWLLLQNDQNADTTLLHSHDELAYSNEARTCMCHKILQSCIVEFIHKDYNTLNYRRHKHNRYIVMIFLLFSK